jgi:hypothetical protein
LTEEWIQPFNFLKVVGCHQKLLSNYKILAETLLKVTDDVRFVLDQHAYFYSAGSLKKQSVGKHVAPLGYIILILSQP